jgi:FKBP-type peptidyl-prolyl cis-trans isomerase SlpA
LAFSLKLANGELIATASAQVPLVWTLGDGSLAPCLEAVLAVPLGVPQCVIFSPDLAFGWPEAARLLSLPRRDFAALEPLVLGQILSFDTPEGQALAGRVLRLEAEQVQVDFNHPLAGHVLIFEFERLEVQHEN